MPDWCFLDDADPDWDDLCLQWNRAQYTQIDATWYTDKAAARAQVDELKPA